MKLFRVIVELELPVLAGDSQAAERVARRILRSGECDGEIDDAQIIASEINSDLPEGWEDCLPWADENVPELTCEEWVKKHKA